MVNALTFYNPITSANAALILRKCPEGPATLVAVFSVWGEGFTPSVATLAFSAYAPSPGKMAVKPALNLVASTRIKDFF